MNNAKVLCLGELMLDMVANTDSENNVYGFDMKPGGAAGNVAVAVSRLGGSAGILAKVSDDFFGHYMKKIMNENGVDTSGIIFDSDRKIAMAFVTFDAGRKPNYLFYRENSASASFECTEIHSELFNDAKALYFSSMGLVRDPLRMANYAAAQMAALAGARVAFDPNIRFGVWPSRKAVHAEVLSMMHYVHICKMNDEELEFLFGKGSLQDRCSAILDAYPKMELIAITLGGDGAFLMNQSRKWAQVPALENEVVDTVGAGDSFFATLIMQAMQADFQLDTEEKLRSALEYANAAALITAKRPGAIPAMPFLKEVEEKRAQYERL